MIAPVPEGVARPAWSVMIPTYRSDDLLAECLASVLAQAPGPEVMQIEVVDDASPDGDAAAVVAAVGDGRVAFHRQPANVGAPRNFTTCVERARGRWVHVLHADDLVLPGFYDRYDAAIEAAPSAGMVVGPSHVGGADGVPTHRTPPLPIRDGLLVDPVEALAIDRHVNFPAVVIDRAAHERLGGYDPGLVHANDWELWTRVAAAFPVAAVDEPLAVYRRHPASDTDLLLRTAVPISDLARAAAVIRPRLPSRAARRRLLDGPVAGGADLALRMAEAQVTQGERRRPLALAHWALRLRHDRSTVRRAAAVAAAVGRRSVREWS